MGKVRNRFVRTFEKIVPGIKTEIKQKKSEFVYTLCGGKKYIFPKSIVLEHPNLDWNYC